MPLPPKIRNIVLVNAFLGLLYLLSDYENWQLVNNWFYNGVRGSTWVVIIIIPHLEPNFPGVLISILNIPLVLFFLLIMVNLYFIIKLQKSKDVELAQR